MPFVESNNAEIYYEVKGKGAPIVFTHGASLNGELWKRQVDYFSKTHKVITWDVRGHGKSTLPDGKIDGMDFCRDLVGILDHLDIEKAHLCGLSMGAMITLEMAINYPERIIKGISIGGQCTSYFNTYEKVLAAGSRFTTRFTSMKTISSMQVLALTKYNNEAEYIQNATMSIAHDRWVRLWDAITRMDFKKDLSKITCPILLLVGDHDKLMTMQQEFMLETIPNSELVKINNANHISNLDNPKDVNKEIERFILK